MMSRTALHARTLVLAHLLAPVLVAQTDIAPFERFEGPVGRVHYDLATQRVTKLVRPSAVSKDVSKAEAEGTSASQRAVVRGFRNTITSGFVTTGVLGQEFVDWATKSTGQTLTTRIEVNYFTLVDDPGIGGAGASLELGFYTGTTGFCSLGTEAGRVRMTGLPGRTASTMSTYGITYQLTAFLATPIALRDGPIGWSYGFSDADPTGRSQTGPFLTTFCTNTGWDDAYDRWASPPASSSTCVGTFFFGGCSPSLSCPPPPPIGTCCPCGSFYLALVEFAAGTMASSTPYGGSGINPSHLADASGGPVLGLSWLTTVDLASPPAAGASLLAISTVGTIPAGTTLGGLFGGGELLIDPSVLGGPVSFSPSGAHAVPIPPVPGLDGVTIAAQAAKLAGPGQLVLTNALDAVIGG